MSAPALEIQFTEAARASITRGPYTALRFEGEVLREVAGGPMIARHEGHRWVVDGEHYTRLDCSRRVSVQFERVDGTTSQAYGPFDHFSCVDGVAFADRQVFAFADRSIVDWYCHQGGEHWPLMVVRPAG